MKVAWQLWLQLFRRTPLLVVLANLLRAGALYFAVQWLLSGRGAFVAPTEGHAITSLASRMRTAAFLRLTAKNVERVTIVTSQHASFVIKTILRTAGAANVELVDVERAPEHLARLRALR